MTKRRVARNGKRGASPPAIATGCALLAQSEPFDQRSVRVRVRPLEVIQQLATAAHHTEQTATRVMVLDVSFEVLRQIGDTRSQERDLDLGGASVALCPLVILHQLGFLRNVYGHVVLLRGSAAEKSAILRCKCRSAQPI